MPVPKRLSGYKAHYLEGWRVAVREGRLEIPYEPGSKAYWRDMQMLNGVRLAMRLELAEKGPQADAIVDLLSEMEDMQVTKRGTDEVGVVVVIEQAPIASVLQAITQKAHAGRVAELFAEAQGQGAGAAQIVSERAKAFLPSVPAKPHYLEKSAVPKNEAEAKEMARKMGLIGPAGPDVPVPYG